MNSSGVRIGVYFDRYEPAWEVKDPGQIVLGLNDLGVEAELITVEKPSLRGYQQIPLRFVQAGEASRPEYWRSTPYDVVIIYTWLGRPYLPIIAALKKAGKKVIVKGDIDGRLCYPAFPRSVYRTRKVGKLLRHMPGPLRALAEKTIARLRTLPRRIIPHLEAADALVLESPQAKANLAYILVYWGRPDLTGKIHFIPNPVADDIARAPIPARKKRKIVAVGRWHDVAKNTGTLARVLCSFARAMPDYEAAVIGPGEETVRRYMAEACRGDPAPSISVLGRVPRGELVRHLGEARILFMPSNWESFGIAAAEAVSMGCSIVGTPIESLMYLTRGGFSGTLAPDFSEKALLAALLTDVQRWEAGEYDPGEIASFWRSRLNRRTVARSYLELAARLLEEGGRQRHA